MPFAEKGAQDNSRSEDTVRVMKPARCFLMRLRLIKPADGREKGLAKEKKLSQRKSKREGNLNLDQFVWQARVIRLQVAAGVVL